MLLNPYRFSVGGGGGGVNPDAQAILASLISWWDLEEASGAVFADSHGSFDLAARADVSGMTTTGGKVGRSTNASLSSHAAYAVTGTEFAFGDESFTVFLWHYPVAAEPSVAVIAAKYYTVSNHRSYEVSRQSATGNFVVNMSSDGTIATTTTHQGPAKTPTDTAFNLVAFGYNAATNMGFLIVDGVRSEFAHAGGVFAASSALFGIGARVQADTTTNATGLGRHDSAGVMSSAITDDQYAVLYNAGSGLNYAGLVALT